MAEKKVKKLVLDRDRWVRGRLVACNGQKGQYCAIGAYLTQVGVPPEHLQAAGGGATNYEIDHFIELLPEEASWLFRSSEAGPCLTAASEGIMGASDTQNEDGMKAIFKQYGGIEVEFTGEYPHK